MVFTPALKFPKPSHFFRKKIKAACSKKNDGAGSGQEGGNTVSLPKGNRESGPYEKTEKNKDTAEYSGGDISSRIGHAERDAKKAKEGTSQRVGQTIPVLCLVGSAKTIIEARAIGGEASDIGPREFIGGKKT
jgi:hypothetical protein